MQVTWSDTESCQSSEKESNTSEECTNFTAFMASVIKEPLKKEVLSESCEVSKSCEVSDSDGDEISFDSAYEALYKECLSLKQEQVEWKASKRSLINENENQVCKNELSLRKEESHLNSKELSDLINSQMKSFDKRGLGFVDETTTPSSGNRSFLTNFIEFDGRNVTFGDGNIASVKGKDTICAPDIPNLEEVANKEVIKGIPRLGKPSNPIYGSVVSLLCFCSLVLMFSRRFGNGSGVVPFVYNGSCRKELAFHGVVGTAYNLFDEIPFRDMGSWNA
ncbi:hypothetical protein CK203_035071 [Vitis vinifera]|uniref:Uncharacterized protein n=1 Tax=Vitis vinifera TaxID=29760 RepID=A0A438I9Q8_VITVI|nr:hypothetical protein CK203_035071 [Vitis vinifera]